MKKMSFIITLLFTLLILVNTVFAGPSVTITSPNDNSYFLQGNTMTVRAYVSGSPTSVTAYYECRQSATNNTYNVVLLGNLIREGTTNYYSYSFTISGVAYPRLYYPLYIVPPRIQVVATDSTGSTTATKLVTLCHGSNQTYTSMDNSFYYSSATSNPFKGAATGHPDYNGVPIGDTYNCMAYAVDYYYGWLWPWSSNPSDSQLVTTMRSYGYNINNKNLSSIPFPTVVYYSGGHFSKVVAWNTSGTPTTIVSKWGGMEKIQSANYNPFVNSSYGAAYYYFKK